MRRIINFIKALLGKCESKPLGEDLWERQDGVIKVKLNRVQQLPKGKGTYLTGKGLERPILIVRTKDGRYMAFTNRCSHVGRKLDPVPGEAKLRCCSLSHSTFGYDGKVLSGPAKHPITRHDVEAKKEELIIRLKQ